MITRLYSEASASADTRPPRSRPYSGGAKRVAVRCHRSTHLTPVRFLMLMGSWVRQKGCPAGPVKTRQRSPPGWWSGLAAPSSRRRAPRPRRGRWPRSRGGVAVAYSGPASSLPGNRRHAGSRRRARRPRRRDRRSAGRSGGNARRSGASDPSRSSASRMSSLRTVLLVKPVPGELRSTSVRFGSAPCACRLRLRCRGVRTRA